jgi:hypothetical protein
MQPGCGLFAQELPEGSARPRRQWESRRARRWDECECAEVQVDPRDVSVKWGDPAFFLWAKDFFFPLFILLFAL